MTDPDQLPALPVFAWAHNARPEFVHHAVKDLWLKVSAQRVENYTEALVLLDDAITAIATERARADALRAEVETEKRRTHQVAMDYLALLNAAEKRADALEAALRELAFHAEPSNPSHYSKVAAACKAARALLEKT